MTSTIDASVPIEGTPTTASVRLQFLRARDEITNLQNSVAAIKGFAEKDALSITMTGEFRYNYVFLITPSLNMQINNAITVCEGKWIDGFIYQEDGLTLSKNLLTISFNDLKGINNNLTVQRMDSLTEMRFPQLEIIKNTIFLQNLYSLATLDIQNVKYIGTTLTIASCYELLAVDIRNLRMILSGINIYSCTKATYINAELLESVNGAISIYDVPAVTEIRLNNLFRTQGNLIIHDGNNVTSLLLGNLTLVFGTLQTYSMPLLTSIDFNKLENVSQTFNPSNMASLNSMLTPELNYIGNTFTISNLQSLATISLPKITRIYSGIYIQIGCDSLTTFHLGDTFKQCNGDVLIQSGIISQISVDEILLRFANMDGTNGTWNYASPRSITIGGASSTPSAAGLASKAILQARGVTVTHN